MDTVTVPVGNLMDVQLIFDHLLERKQVVAEIEAELIGAGFPEGTIQATYDFIVAKLNAAKTLPAS